MILVRGVRQLLTLHGPACARRGAALRDVGMIRDGALLIRGEVIQDVGPGRRIENLAAARSATEIDAGGRVVMPGFVDSHTHSPIGLPWLAEFEERIAARGDASQAAEEAEGGLISLRRSLRTLPLRRLEWQAENFMGKLARHGTTTVECKSGWGPDDATEVKYLRLLAALDRNPLDVVPSYLAGGTVPSDYGGDPAAYVSGTCEHFLPKLRRMKLARFADANSSGTLSTQAIRRYYEAARAAGIPTKAHACGAVTAEAIRLAIEFDSVSVDYLECAREEEMDALARSATVATMLPGHSFHDKVERYEPARSLIDRGAAVALATGFHPGFCPTYNMQTVLSLACCRLRMTPAEAISAATINGAHALRMAHRTGSLEPGKQADLLILNASDYREIPYFLGANCVYTTIKRGSILYREGAVLE